MSFYFDSDIENKIHKFQAVCGTISRTLGYKVQKETIMKFYKVMAASVLSYGSKSWVTTKTRK